MKWILYIVSVLLILVGVGWFLQGINILPGSFMTSQIEWAIAGIVSAIVGIALLVFTRRRWKSAPPTS